MGLGVGSRWGKPATRGNKRRTREGQDCGVPWGGPGVLLRLEIGCLDWLGATCTHLTGEGCLAEAPSKTGVQVPNLQQYINSDRKERGELNRLSHLCQAEISSYSTFKYFLSLRDPARYELPPCWPPQWPDSLATLRGFQHGRLRASHWAVCCCCCQRCTCALIPVGPGFRFHGHKEKFGLSQACQIFFFFLMVSKENINYHRCFSEEEHFNTGNVSRP